MTAGVASPGATRTEGDESVMGRAAADDFGAGATNKKRLWCKVKAVRPGKRKGKKKYYIQLSFHSEQVRHNASRAPLSCHVDDRCRPESIVSLQ